jgi:hypothetical protein
MPHSACIALRAPHCQNLLKVLTIRFVAPELTNVLRVTLQLTNVLRGVILRKATDGWCERICFWHV